jgi:hypothetical protein
VYWEKARIGKEKGGQGRSASLWQTRKIGIADWQTKLKFHFIRTGTRSAKGGRERERVE